MGRLGIGCKKRFDKIVGIAFDCSLKSPKTMKNRFVIVGYGETRVFFVEKRRNASQYTKHNINLRFVGKSKFSFAWH